MRINNNHNHNHNHNNNNNYNNYYNHNRNHSICNNIQTAMCENAGQGGAGLLAFNICKLIMHFGKEREGRIKGDKTNQVFVLFHIIIPHANQM